MNVDLHDGFITDSDHALPHIGERLAGGGEVYALTEHHEVGAVTKWILAVEFRDIIEEVHFGTDLLHRALFIDGGIAERESVHAIQQIDNTLATGIDYPSLTKDIEHLGSFFQCTLCTCDRGLQHVGDAAVSLGNLVRILGSIPNYGEHGAFYRTHYGTICLLSGSIQRLAQIRTGHHLAAFQAVGKASPDLAENHTAVSAGTHKSTVGKPIGEVSYRIGGVGFYGNIQTGVHGERHVGAGIAIGNWEHIQCIHSVTVMAQQPCRERKGIQKLFTSPGGVASGGAYRSVGHELFSTGALTRKPSTFTLTRSTVISSKRST